jgi:hypothetical protein
MMNMFLAAATGHFTDAFCDDGGSKNHGGNSRAITSIGEIDDPGRRRHCLRQRIATRMKAVINLSPRFVLAPRWFFKLRW